jgi:hypothetical protein
MGLAGRYAFAVGQSRVFYVSHDGIYSTQCQGDQPISLTDGALKPIFRGESVGDLEAVDFGGSDWRGRRAGATSPSDPITYSEAGAELTLSLVGNDLHFIYRGADTGNFFHLVADVSHGRWLQWTTNKYRWIAFDEAAMWKRAFLGEVDTKTLYEWDEAFPASTEEFTCQARTGSWSGGVPLTDKQFGVFMLDMDPGFGSAILTFYFNSEADTNPDIGPVDTNTYNFNSRLQRTIDLQSTFARSIAFDLEWTEKPTWHPKFYQGNLLFRVDEEEIVHWSSDWISLDIEGWNHIKDSWWTLRSEGVVRLKVSGEGQDGEIQSFFYDIPDTQGVKKRFYVEHPPILAKMWKFELDGRQELGDDFPPTFKFYGEDSILNVKMWKVGGSYKQLSPFTAPGYASYLRSEGGT